MTAHHSGNNSENKSGEEAAPRAQTHKNRPHGRPSTLRKVTAEILDFLTVFFIGRYVIGLVAGTGDVEVFKLDKWQGIVLVAMIVAYFYLLSRTEGGTLWQRMLKAKRR